jgi:phenylacetate-CoA ligase
LLDHALAVGVDWSRLHTSMIVGEEVLTEAQRTYFSFRLGIDPDRTDGRLVASSFGVGELGLNLLFETRETIAIRRALRRSPELMAQLGIAPMPPSTPSVFCFNPLRCHIEILEPDAQGFGELCITALDTSATILLPRYRTGDLARLITSPEMLAVGATVGCKPWLPALLLRGRIADRGPIGPDVESVKDLIFSDSALVDQLTGAFRISVSGATTRITLQLMPGGDIQTARDRAANLRLPPAMAASGGCQIIVETPADLQWGPPVDHERKFGYRQV